MKRIAMLLVLCMCLGTILAGCAGTIDTGPERCRRYWGITKLQHRQLNDDVDFLLLYERNSRLTEYHARIGQ